MHDDASRGVGIPIPSTSSKESLFSLGRTINFIENCLQCFEVNYDNRITIYKRNIIKLFKTVPKSLTIKKLIVIKQSIRNYQGSIWEIVYRQD